MHELIDNTGEKQFEIHTDDGLARMEYIITGERIYLTHTEVDKGLEGKGMAKVLTETVLGEVEKRGLKFVALCPYVIAYLRRHPEWNRLAYK